MNRGPVTPLQIKRRFTALPLFELVGQLPPPAGAVITGQAGGSPSFRSSFQWGLSTLSVHATIKEACV